MKTKHTPGPWSFVEQGDPNEYVIAREFIPEGTKPKVIKWLAFVQQTGELSTEQQGANMRLICAAPEMLEALEKAQSLLEMARQYFPKSVKNSDRFDLENGLANVIIPAIKKAKGE